MTVNDELLLYGIGMLIFTACIGYVWHVIEKRRKRR